MSNDKATMAAAETAYVSDGPNVQYEAQADVKISTLIGYIRSMPKAHPTKVQLHAQVVPTT